MAHFFHGKTNMLVSSGSGFKAIHNLIILGQESASMEIMQIGGHLEKE